MNTNMKVLSLALVGIGGFAFAGVAAAACPAGPDIGHGGAWTAVNALGGTAVIATPGYAGTACRLNSAVSSGPSAFATVEDDSPSAEPRYRAQFIVDPSSLTGLSASNGAFVFSATSAAGQFPIQLAITGDGSGGYLLNYYVTDTTAPFGLDIGSLPLTSSPSYVEFDLDNGSVDGTPHFSIWVNNNVQASPNFTTTSFDNGQIPVDTAFMGLSTATPGYFTNFSGVAVGFDQFDSRRQTFIGY